MRSNKGYRILAVFALALLTLGFSSTGAIGEEAEETLTGQLSWNEDTGNYVLVEQESGDEIRLEGPDELTDHLGETVQVTGQWAKDDEGNSYFKVSSVESIG